MEVHFSSMLVTMVGPTGPDSISGASDHLFFMQVISFNFIIKFQKGRVGTHMFEEVESHAYASQFANARTARLNPESLELIYLMYVSNRCFLRATAQSPY